MNKKTHSARNNSEKNIEVGVFEAGTTQGTLLAIYGCLVPRVVFPGYRANFHWQSGDHYNFFFPSTVLSWHRRW